MNIKYCRITYSIKAKSLRRRSCRFLELNQIRLLSFNFIISLIMHIHLDLFLNRVALTYRVSVAVRSRVISRGYPKSIGAVSSPSRPAASIDSTYLPAPRRPHNVASITPSGSINKLRSRDIYRLHTGALFLRPHSPGLFRHGPSIKGTSSPTSV